jgi:hypothetical protein
LTAEVYNWQETNGTTDETVSLTNISPTSCTLSGYAVLGANAANGTPLPATTADVPTLSTTPVVGNTTAPPTTAPPTTPPSTVPLAPGARAWFELSFADICDHVLEPGATPTAAPNECFAGTWLEVEPYKGADALIVTQPIRLTYGTSGFLVGPFEAGIPPG